MRAPFGPARKDPRRGSARAAHWALESNAPKRGRRTKNYNYVYMYSIDGSSMFDFIESKDQQGLRGKRGTRRM